VELERNTTQESSVNEAAAEQQTRGLGEYPASLWRRRWIVLVSLILFPATAFVVAVRQDSQYRSSADVLIEPSNVGATVLGAPDPSIYQDPQRFSDTQAALARVPEVVERAARIANTPGVDAAFVLESSDVAAGVDTDLLRFSATNRDPRLAAKLATSYAQAFIAYRREFDEAALGQARGNLTQRLGQLRAGGASNTALYANLSNRERQLQTLELLQRGDTLVRPAVTADKIAPTPGADAVKALLSGAVFGLGLAFLLEVIDKRARSEEEIERRLGLPLLGRIPRPPRFARKKKLVMLRDPTSSYAEAFRQLASNLEFLSADSQARTILVTSAVTGEGKSTTAGNLAVAAARGGRRVALVDLDLRRGRLHELLGVPPRPGATDVVLGNVVLEDALRPIHLRSTGESLDGAGKGDRATGTLEFLPTGASPPSPGEFLAREGIAAILAELSEHADCVVIDAAPLLGVGDALSLGAEVDAIVVVSRLGVVSRPMLAQLARELQRLQTPTVGFVVTGLKATTKRGYRRSTAKRKIGARRVALD